MQIVPQVLISMLFATTWAQQPQPVPLTTYSDRANGVAFQYPSVWKLSLRSAGFTPPLAFEESPGIPEHTVPVLFGVVFTGKGNYYEHTSLEALGFFYGVVRNSSAGACAKIAADVAASLNDNVKTTRPSVNGIVFTAAKGEEGSTGHGISAEVYTTFHSRRCFVFEEDTDTTDLDLPGASRKLTNAETKALEHHLDNIMQSVRFASPQ